MQTPVILYTSAGIPIGPRAVVTFYRPASAADTTGTYPAGYTAPAVAAVVAFGGESGATSLGNFIIEDLSLDLPSTEYSQSGTFMEDLNNPAVVRGKPALSLKATMAGAGTPTLCPGDFISIAVGMKATSTPAAIVPCPVSRWVVTGDNINTSGVNSFGLKLSLDRVNSDPALKEF